MPVAGSRKWFKYTTDDGDVFAMQSDEGNQEALAAETGVGYDLTGADATKYAVPVNVKKRMSYWGQGDSTVAIPVGTLEAYQGLSPGDSVDVPIASGGSETQNYAFIRKRPELVNYPRPDDSGLNDGDAS